MKDSYGIIINEGDVVVTHFCEVGVVTKINKETVTVICKESRQGEGGRVLERRMHPINMTVISHLNLDIARDELIGRPA